MPATKWKQGEHVIIIGDTGTGKTYLESKILPIRKHVILMRTKPDDIKFDGFKKVTSQLSIGAIPFGNDAKKITRWMLQPKLNSFVDQRQEINRTFQMAWVEGGWTIVVDECYYISNKLKLQDPLDMLLTQGRSKHITLVVGMQRPAWISRFSLSQATHAFIFRCEGRDLKNLADALSPKIVKPVQELTGHDFVYFNRATREVKIGNANKLGEIFG
jgi:ABC-type dipeptide/oligopeptide/nickel transport system ATPase component